MSSPNLGKQVAGFVFWLALVFAAAAVAAAASVGAGEFYAGLTRPDWAPPAAVFGPVWSRLYTLTSIAAWLVWQRESTPASKAALCVFLVQLAVNALWSWLFFAWHLGGAAFADIVLLWALIVINVVGFWRIDRLAAAMLLPYLAWVSFAAALNFAIWQLNP